MSKPGRTSSERAAELARKVEAERQRLGLARIDMEIARLSACRETCTDRDECVALKAEIVHLRRWKERIASGRWYPLKKRRPPEAGIAVPAVPPRGPLPKQGGAAAPLDLDRS